MKTLQNIITTTLLAIVMSMAQGVAKESQGNKEQTAQTEPQALDKKIAEIEAQINGLEKKGLENLTDEEFVKYSELSDKLLITQKEKTAEQRNIIKAIDETDKKIDELSGMMSTSK